MTDEQIEQHIVMERGGNISRCYINENKIKQPKTAKSGVLQNDKG